MTNHHEGEHHMTEESNVPRDELEDERDELRARLQWLCGELDHARDAATRFERNGAFIDGLIRGAQAIVDDARGYVSGWGPEDGLTEQGRGVAEVPPFPPPSNFRPGMEGDR